MSDGSNESLYSKLSKIDLDSLPTNEIEDLTNVLEALTSPSPRNYVPHEKQMLFHVASNKYRLMLGGNRSGKTEAGTIEDIYHATGIYPEWYPQDKKVKGGNRGRVIVTDFKEGARIYEEKLFKWLPKELIIGSPKRVQGSGALERIIIKHISGEQSTIEILTHEQSDSVFEGWSGHWAHFDEPPPRNKFVATIRGLIDFKGRCWLTLTPISEPWLYDEFVANNEDSSIFVVTVDQGDNPHLDKTEREDFEKRLTEDEKEARLHGKFRHLVGRIYKEFDPQIHCISESKIKLNPGCPVYFAFDPADRRPHCGLWARVDPFGTIWVIDEICFAGTIKEVSKQILLRERMNKINPMDVIRVLDPNKGNSPVTAGGIKLVDEFAKNAVYFTTNVNDDVATGHMAVQDRLHFDTKQAVSFTNKPKLYFIKENTQKCVKQLQSYVWEDWKDSSRDKKEKPKDVNKDFPDCLRYLVMINPVFFTKSGNQDPEYGNIEDDKKELPTRFTK